MSETDNKRVYPAPIYRVALINGRTAEYIPTQEKIEYEADLYGPVDMEMFKLTEEETERLF